METGHGCTNDVMSLLMYYVLSYRSAVFNILMIVALSGALAGQVSSKFLIFRRWYYKNVYFQFVYFQLDFITNCPVDNKNLYHNCFCDITLKSSFVLTVITCE